MTEEEASAFNDMVTDIDDWALFLSNPFLYHSRVILESKASAGLKREFYSIFLKQMEYDALKEKLVLLFLKWPSVCKIAKDCYEAERPESFLDKLVMLGKGAGLSDGEIAALDEFVELCGSGLRQSGVDASRVISGIFEKCDKFGRPDPEGSDLIGRIYEAISGRDRLVLDGKIHFYDAPELPCEEMFATRVNPDVDAWYEVVYDDGVYAEVYDREFDSHESMDYMFEDTEGYGKAFSRIAGGISPYNSDWTQNGLRIIDLSGKHALKGLMSALCLLRGIYYSNAYQAGRKFGGIDSVKVVVFNSDFDEVFKFDGRPIHACVSLSWMFEYIFYDKFMLKKFIPCEMYSDARLPNDIRTPADYLKRVDMIYPGSFDFFKRNRSELDSLFPGLCDMLDGKIGIGSDYWFDGFDFEKDLELPSYSEDKSRFSRFDECAKILNHLTDEYRAAERVKS